MPKMEPVTVAIPRDLKRWLERAAKATEQSLGSYVRRVLKLHRITEEEESHAQRPVPDAAPDPSTSEA